MRPSEHQEQTPTHAQTGDQIAYGPAESIRLQGYLFEMQREIESLTRHIAALEEQVVAQEAMIARRQCEQADAPDAHADAGLVRPWRSAPSDPVLFRFTDTPPAPPRKQPEDALASEEDK